MATSRKIRLAMLNCDTPVPNVISTFPTYGDMFGVLLKNAADRVSPSQGISYLHFDVVSGHYPNLDEEWDGMIITGSASSAYDEAHWIQMLCDFIAGVHANRPQIKIFGSCFGHQLIGRSLLQGHVVVEKDPNGWEVGVKEIELHEDFVKCFVEQQERGYARSLTPDMDLDEPWTSKHSSMRLQFVHSDHVRIVRMPENWTIVGSTTQCANQGMYQPGRILTLQGHFEFDKFVNTEIMKVFGANWPPEKLQAAFLDIDAEDDSKVAANIVMKFLLGLDLPASYGGCGQSLQTPPGEFA